MYLYCKLPADTVRKFQQLLAKIKNGSSEDLAPFKNLNQYLDSLSGDGQIKADTSKTSNNNDSAEKKKEDNKKQKSEHKSKAKNEISPDKKTTTNEKMEEEKSGNQDDEVEEVDKEHKSKKKGSSKKANANGGTEKKKEKGSKKSGKSVKVSLSNEPVSESKPESNGLDDSDEDGVEPGKRKLSDEEDDKAYTIKKKVKTNLIDVDQDQEENKTEVSQSAKSSLQFKGTDKEADRPYAHHNFFINKLSDQ